MKSNNTNVKKANYSMYFLMIKNIDGAAAINLMNFLTTRKKARIYCYIVSSQYNNLLAGPTFTEDATKIC